VDARRDKLAMVEVSLQHLQQLTCCGEKAEKSAAKFRVWEKVPEGSILIFGDTQNLSNNSVR